MVRARLIIYAHLSLISVRKHGKIWINGFRRGVHSVNRNRCILWKHWNDYTSTINSTVFLLIFSVTFYRRVTKTAPCTLSYSLTINFLVKKNFGYIDEIIPRSVYRTPPALCNVYEEQHCTDEYLFNRNSEGRESTSSPANFEYHSAPSTPPGPSHEGFFTPRNSTIFPTSNSSPTDTVSFLCRVSSWVKVYSSKLCER